MSDLYGDDIVLWCEQQADALRRRAAHELDWDNLAGRIENVGKTQSRAIDSSSSAPSLTPDKARDIARALKWLADNYADVSLTHQAEAALRDSRWWLARAVALEQGAGEEADR